MQGEAASENWKDEAACRGKPAWFFPPHERGSAVAAWRVEVRPLAQAVCAACPVRAECEEYAHANGEETGIWGGVDFGVASARQRSQNRRDGDGFHMDAHTKAAIRRRAAEGVSARAIASMFRITERSVYRCLKGSS